MFSKRARLALVILLLSLSRPPATRAQTPVTAFRAGSEPACDASRRGSIIVVTGAAGHSDLLKACLRDGVGRFSWVTADEQNTNSFSRTRVMGGCPIFPDNNVWNSTVDKLPVSPESAGITGTYAASTLGTVPDFTINFADSRTPTDAIRWEARESDNGRYPVAPDMRVEGFGPGFSVSGGPYKGDSHLLVIQTEQCKLFEVFGLKTTKPPHVAYSGAIYDLMQNRLRPDGWTSADAAGLPIWPGVLTYAEVYGQEEIRHMVRFTVDRTRNSFVWPARHYASRSGDPARPPMGSRWRLKASVDENVCRATERAGLPYPPEVKRLIRALKRYGMILADNGIAIRISTDADARWGAPGASNSPEAVLNGWTHCMTGRDFEVVDATPLIVHPDSAEVNQ